MLLVSGAIGAIPLPIGGSFIKRMNARPAEQTSGHTGAAIVTENRPTVGHEDISMMERGRS
jgi:hypothetical protein